MKLPPWQKIFRKWAQAGKDETLRRITVSEPRLCAAALARVLASCGKGQVLAVTADSAAAEELLNAWSCLREIAGERRPVIPLPEVQPGRRQWIPDNEAGRSAALQEAVSGTPALYIATVSTLMAQTVAPRTFRKQVFSLKCGDTISPEKLAGKLVQLDYDNEVEVASPGEFSRRGGIMDIFSPLYRDPVRIEFWGDEIDSMRFFSAETQCSTENITEFKVLPRGNAVSGGDAETLVPMREYFAPEVPLVLCDPGAIEVHLCDYCSVEDNARWQEMVAAASRVIRIETPPLLSTSPGSRKLRSLAPPSEEPELDVALLGDELNAALPEMGSDGVALWHWQQLRGELCRWYESGYSLVACCSGEGELERFSEMLRGDSVTADIPVILEHRQLSHGLFFPNIKLVLLSDQELFGRESVRRRLAHVDYRCNTRLRNDELLELEDGALAVHVNHGICRYHGISCKNIDGEMVEVIELEFADDAKLYVPVEQAMLVSRYMGGSKNEPRLSSLGTKAWSNIKEKAENAAWDLAAELIRLEAMREASDGYQFKPATEWERAFAGSFPYELTADQQAALDACLADMASPRPMDRLLCGDVGYGKTEVAMRVAFRAVMNGKQVALLVPTTVLAQQHYQTFSARLAEFPVKVEMLSRFRSPAEQKEIVKRLATGGVDIIIGTHRLVSGDVKFSNLGLLIIDEEQRFGVRHKQQLKALRASLDILTMTATPIPRTLYFSLSGLRNLSTIMTAPAHRLPVATVVANYDDELVERAILNEVQRGGQVFFLHNRVNTIGKVAEKLRARMPAVSFQVAHGRMTPEELEAVMTDFVAGKFQVLVCTTIIESGIDIPNANTMIIDRADRFGLSELYQLRGRVGRYFRQAYAYMLLAPMGILPHNARERLAAIRRFTHLGAGFRLAMKDLEIRGAGNILGQEQSGHIAAVGFELYCQLLKDAVGRLSNQPAILRSNVQIDLEMVAQSMKPVPGRACAAIPMEYIADDNLRIQSYRKLQTMESVDEVEKYAEELRDRFGTLPRAVLNLLAVTRIRVVAQQKKLLRLAVNHGRFVVETQNGLYRVNGQIPQIDTANPEEALAECERLLMQIPHAKSR